MSNEEKKETIVLEEVEGNKPGKRSMSNRIKSIALGLLPGKLAISIVLIGLIFSGMTTGAFYVHDLVLGNHKIAITNNYEAIQMNSNKIDKNTKLANYAAALATYTANGTLSNWWNERIEPTLARY